ncbi:hypothetical protein [Lewinella sp. IMCC34191]|uniref:hypothetical protein n=1 Tax=Lewinella sp. IMCC34191 TaxID=2259172 RepID=UPI000E226A1C|nr:hypothetical protein [Lewinella sp. IMCC34191]
MNHHYRLEKFTWNQDDFDQMGWHDVPIYAMSFEDDVKFDLDYIFEWVEPKKPETSFKFWISPATLIFKNPTDLKINLSIDFVNGLEIADIVKQRFDGKTTYLIETQQGDIQIETESFLQIIRHSPSLQKSQSIDGTARGGISFAAVPGTPE